MKTYFVVQYEGPFAFIKPWTAVRDSETFSQQFLTPSTIEGMEKKLFPELLQQRGKICKILRHRLNYRFIDIQQERTWSKGGFLINKKKKNNLGIINRGILMHPHLHLAFSCEQDAQVAYSQHLCMCRNEDILLPKVIEQMTVQQFDELEGFEFMATDKEQGFCVGYNRYTEQNMYEILKTFGHPLRGNEGW